jgi:hypothetical protein
MDIMAVYRWLQWAAKWIAIVIGVQLSIFGAIATYDSLSANSVQTFISEHGLQMLVPAFLTLYFLVPLVLVLPVVSVINNRSGWDSWCGCFRYAGLAEMLDLALVFPQRRMDIAHVPLKRSLLSRLSLTDPPNVAVKVTDGTEAFLLELVSKTDWQQGHCGFLIEGTAMVGKTRFVGEWIRRYQAKTFLLVPTRGILPAFHPRLAKYKSKGITLFLDDLDDFSPVTADICSFLETLHRKHISCVIISTVRDSGPSQRIQSEPTFRTLRDQLYYFALEPLTYDQMNEVGEKVGILPPRAPRDREPTFSWLLDNQFQEMRRRFRIEITELERSLLYAARMIDCCGIPITRERWFIVAQEVLDLSHNWDELSRA